MTRSVLDAVRFIFLVFLYSVSYVTYCYWDIVGWYHSVHFQQSSLTILISILSIITLQLVTGPPNGPISFCLLASVICCRRCLWLSSVTLSAGGPGAWAVGRPTMHGGPVRLRSVRATLCFYRLSHCTLTHRVLHYYIRLSVCLSVHHTVDCIDAVAKLIIILFSPPGNPLSYQVG